MRQNEGLLARVGLLGAYALAMGYVEAAVVIYLRRLCYPGGFCFPLRALPPNVLSIEMLREVATIVMLVSVTTLAGRRLRERIAFFLLAFGVWDISYYAGLKLWLGWPPSFLTWDVLFLIPIVWTSPVAAPIICSTLMICCGSAVLWVGRKAGPVLLSFPEFLSLALGVLLVLVSFLWNYLGLVVTHILTFGALGAHSTYMLQQKIAEFVPTQFPWFLFTPGVLAACLGGVRYLLRLRGSCPQVA